MGKTYELQPTVVSWPCVTVALFGREPGDSEYTEHDGVQCATKEMADDVLKEIGDLGDPYWCVGEGDQRLTTERPETDFDKAVARLREIIEEAGVYEDEDSDSDDEDSDD